MYTRNNDEENIDVAIKIAEDKFTVISKNIITNVRQVTINAAHTVTDKAKKHSSRGAEIWVRDLAERHDVSSIASNTAVNMCNSNANLKL